MGGGAETVKSWAYDAPPVGIGLGVSTSKGIVPLLQAPVQQTIQPLFVLTAPTASREQVAPAPEPPVDQVASGYMTGQVEPVATTRVEPPPPAARETLSQARAT